MEKLENLQKVANYITTLSEELNLDFFYCISIRDNEVTLQGSYESNVAKCFGGAVVDTLGYITTTIDLENITLIIILT